MKLLLCPVTLEEANAFVEKWHRHHKPVPGAKFCIGVASDGEICGVAIVGRPVARMLDDGWTLEVNRTCTDGTPNANSMLYGAARRVAWGLASKDSSLTHRGRKAGQALKLRGLEILAKQAEARGAEQEDRESTRTRNKRKSSGKL